MEYLTMAQAAKMMNVDYHTLFKWVKEGKGPAYYRPSQYTIGFRHSDVNDWVNKFHNQNELIVIKEGSHINVYRKVNREHVCTILAKEMDSIIEAIKRYHNE